MRVSFFPLNSNAKTCVVAMATLTLCTYCLALAQLPTQDKVKYVALGAASARENLRCATASFQYEDFSPHEYNYFISEPSENSARTFDLAQDKKEELNVWWHINNEKLAMFVQQKGAKEIWSYKRLVSDGRKARYLTQYKDPENPQNGIYYRGVEASPDLYVDENGYWKQQFYLDPRFDVYPSYDVTKFQDAGQEEVFGSTCFKLKKEKDDEVEFFWVDAEHDFLLRKRAAYSKTTGKNTLVAQTTVPRLHSSNGRWFPALIEFEYTLVMRADKLPAKMPRQRLTFAGDMAVLPTKTGRIEFPTFESDCFQSPETYILDWPYQTQVYDYFKEETYVVRWDGVKRDKSADAASLPKAEDDPNNRIAVAKPSVPVGQTALDFTAVDINGKTWKLSELRGKKNLLLTFFPKCFTGGCANHLSSLRDVYAQLQAADVEVLAVSIDPAKGEKGQQEFARQWKLPFPLVPDTQRTLSMLYGAAQNKEQLAARMSVLIDKQGVVRWTETNVNVQRHGADVLTKIRELGLDKR